jgi:deazaflavin-dependent oxidoreductase (nitroreductase family)
MLLLWRLGLGAWVNAWPSVGGRILVLTHTGRKTGRRRQTPVNYALVNGQVYVAAGFGAVSDWYRNLQADPRVEVWLPDGWWAGRAQDVSGSPDRLRLLRQVLIGSGFVAPLLGLDARRVSDAELAQSTAGYRLLRLSRDEARTGPNGPGELAWIWPALVFVLLARRLGRRPRR